MEGDLEPPLGKARLGLAFLYESARYLHGTRRTSCRRWAASPDSI
jgi:hypothetical protein